MISFSYIYQKFDEFFENGWIFSSANGLTK